MMDEDKIRQAVRLLLEGIGEDPDREGLAETPDRIARMCHEVFGGLEADATEHLSKTFSVDRNELVVEKDIPFQSVCEHHLLPFFGKAQMCIRDSGQVNAEVEDYVKQRLIDCQFKFRLDDPPEKP